MKRMKTGGAIWSGLLALVLAGAGEARAEGEASFFLGRSYAGDLLVLDMTTVGGTLGAFAGPIGFEFGLEYSPVADFDIGPIGLGASVTNIMGNLVVQVPAGRFAPYGTVGYGAFIAQASIDPLPVEFLGTFGAFNYGFGAKVFFTEHVGVRIDYRRFAVQTEDDDPKLEIPFTGITIDSGPDLDRLAIGAAFRF